MARYPGNFTDSDVLNVPRQLRTRPGSPQVELAYVTPQEQGILQALKPGTPHKGPKGIPNYDSIDYNPNTGQYSVTTGAQASAQEVSPRDRTPQEKIDVAAAPEPSSLPSGQAYAFDPETYQPITTTGPTSTQVKPLIIQGATPIVEGEETPEDIPPKKKGAIETFLGSTLTAQLVGGMLSGPQATSNFFKKLAGLKPGEELSSKDKIILANLMAADKRGANVFGETVLDDWMEKFDVSNKKGFLSSLDEEKKGLESGVTITDASGKESKISYEDLIKQYTDRKPEGLDSFKAMYGDLTGTRDLPEGTMTREELKKRLGKEGIAYLKANDPAKYYSFIDPQTTGSLEELANLQVTDTMQGENKDLVRKIFEARQTLGTEKLRQDQAGQEGGRLWGAGGAGIADLATPIPDPLGIGAGETVTAPSTTTVPGATATTVPGATTLAATPFDYSQWPQFDERYPGHYANWGIPGQAWPQYTEFNRIANTYPGMSQYG